ncbi:hypothetical protein K458DRAFT_461457 [Lentithecium fluviatile CBS 122367]|uniref:DDE-1 domain-containing protein n=1 Tax=Lentithecium fluviatile CBS 122367 TaxID=1168545 RepID=A0A6G1ILL9_9PLEO|nr:hypothetical protein K458DRAFT_461457 [Lentithecium fluviatile CBS 122367]
MDEKGVLLGQAQVSRVIVSDIWGYHKRHAALRKQPGGRELVTAIEAVSANGKALSPLIVFKAKHHSERWVQLKGGRIDWNFAVSRRG